MPCRLPSLNSCHRPKLGRNSKISVPIRYFLLRFYTNPSLFLGFTVSTSFVYFFWSFPINPPLRISKTPACGKMRLQRPQPTSWIFSGGYKFIHAYFGWNFVETVKGYRILILIYVVQSVIRVERLLKFQKNLLVVKVHQTPLGPAQSEAQQKIKVVFFSQKESFPRQCKDILYLYPDEERLLCRLLLT